MGCKRSLRALFCVSALMLLGGISAAQEHNAADLIADPNADWVIFDPLSGETVHVVKDDLAVSQTGAVAAYDGVDVTFKGKVTVTSPVDSDPASPGYGSGGLYIMPSGVGTKGATATFEDDVSVANGYLDIKVNSTATFEAKTTAKAIIIDYSTATFKGAVTADNIDIEGPSKVVFDDTLTVADGIDIYDLEEENAPSVTGYDAPKLSGMDLDFNGAVTAKWMGLHGAAATVTFSDTLTLTGIDQEAVNESGVNFKPALVVTGGTNLFKKDVTLNAGEAIFAKSTSTFNAHLDAGSENVSIGYSDIIQDVENAFGDAPGFHNQPTTVILNGTNAEITAANVNVFKNGTLQLGSDAAVNGALTLNNGGALDVGLNTLTITGNATFKTGSTYAATLGASKNSLVDVQGTATVETGANLILKGIDPSQAIGSSIFTSSNAINGIFSNALYDLALSSDGKSLEIGDIKSADAVVENTLGSGGLSQNFASAAGVANQVMAAGGALGTKIGDALQVAASMNPERAKAAFSQLFGEHGLAGISASQTTAQNFSGSVGNHQVQLRDAAFASASATVSAGSSSALASFASGASGFNPNRIWGGGFGAWTDQDDRNSMTGYEYRSGGFILGYDRQIGNSLIVGVTGAYSTGEIENNDGYTTTDVDTFNVGLYASYNHCSGFFADVNAGFGFAWNDTETEDIINGGRKTGDYNNTSFQLGTTVGYAFTLPQDFRFIPSVGVQYTHVSQDAWNEKVNATQIANAFDESKQNYVSIPVQVRVNKTFNLGNGASITPEVRGAWIYEARDPQARVRMGYVGSNASTTLYGIDTGRSRGLIGAGVKAKFNNCVDAFVDYNYEFRSGYSNHNVMAGLGLSF